ncbi:MAG: short chain dehydrogenase [Myxococcaceae bacterium]|nr:short chain dehydrogenase [Myxococcaceae bacterium]
MSKTWFVTGSSRGLGRAFVEAALARGDRVAATARNADTLVDLAAAHGARVLALALDVTDRRAVFAAVSTAVDRFGGLDVVVNNAGHGVLGAVEEVPESAFRDVMDVNFFGALYVVQAALPFLRSRGRGHIIQISSMGGLLGLPLAGSYIASKWALEGLSEVLTQEVAGLGIAVTTVEPSAFATSQGHGAADPAHELDVYESLRNSQKHHGAAPGDPVDAARALLRVVDSPKPPARVIIGKGPVEFIEKVYARRLAGWHEASALLG